MSSFILTHDRSSPVSLASHEQVSSGQTILALRIETKYQFLDADGAVCHEYVLPSDRDIQNCGGYVDKLLKYRSPQLVEFILDDTPSPERFRNSPWPVLHGRSPRIDLILNDLISAFRKTRGDDSRVSLLDHGCSVAEHFDFLDLLFRQTLGRRAADILTYYGLDVSGLVLGAARLFHQTVVGDNFRLILSEGSDFDLLDDSIDFSLSVGVVNHVTRPLDALDNLLRVTRFGFVTAIWVTAEAQGFWALNHSGLSNYFFAEQDLAALARKHPKGKFYTAEFVPEHDSTQPSSYVGLSEERLLKIGSYILVYSTMQGLPASLQPLDFG